MIDALAAASSAVAAITPALVEMGKGLAEGVGEGGAGKLLGWLRAKLSGRGQEALAELASDPDSADNQADLRKQLKKLLEQEPALLDELRALLPAPGTGGDTMTQSVGAGGQGVLINKGSGNTVTF